ncbi:MAG: 50S ribosomal protein L29 [Patescibacteria group bacterium]|nr:50S ribosomal protein L29 [Patescibacteria group bacterium]MCX7589895.1 50S ribosomal protein L29 [Patescibacteria group bacterium]MDW8279576.1 50S ribosomal protein L29 [bacterium]
MKKNDFKQLKMTATIEELNKILFEKRKALKQMKFDLNSGKVKNIKDIKKLKKDIAQILTLINEMNKNIK